jgi:fumarate hydratase class II
MGNDVTIGLAGASGNFELNVYKPVLIYNLLQSIRLIADACDSFAGRCVAGIKPNESNIRKNLLNSLMLVTALNPHIGYDRAAEVAKKAYAENITLRQAAVALGFMSAGDFDKLVKPEDMIKPKAKTNDTDQ